METCSPNTAFWRPGITVQVQSVIYHNEFSALRRSADSGARAAQLAISSGACSNVSWHYGDSSPSRIIDNKALDSLRNAYADCMLVEYQHFEQNLGSAGGHNQLAKNSEADFILIQNPDVVVSPRTIELLLKRFCKAGVGMVEAKQVPVEHPKDYDLLTGETSWASGACVMIPTPLFRQLSGFDAENFFMYCDDVDLSWRVRQAGYRIIFQPGAIAFHHKQLSHDAGWKPSAAEKYYSAEASLFMAHKWSRPDLVDKYTKFFQKSGDEIWTRAANAFLTRQREGRLPEPIDSEHQIGTFVGINYAPHRYTL